MLNILRETHLRGKRKIGWHGEATPHVREEPDTNQAPCKILKYWLAACTSCHVPLRSPFNIIKARGPCGEFAEAIAAPTRKHCVSTFVFEHVHRRICSYLPELARTCPNLPRVCLRICQIHLVDHHVTMCFGLPVWPRRATMLTRTWHSCFVFSLRATMHAWN